MKKILSLFALGLMASAGAMAQQVVQTPKVSTATTHYYYTFHCESREAHLTEHYLGEVEGVIIGRAQESTRFEFETADGGFYMKSVESGKYVNWTGSAASLTDTPETTWTVSPVTDGHGCKSVGLIPSDYSQSLNNNVNTSPYLQLRAYGETNYCSLWSMQEYVEGSVTNLAELSNDKTYTIRSNRRGWWTAVGGSNNIWQTNGRNDSNADFTSGSGKAQDETDADQQWAILKSENDNYYLYNVGQQKFFASSDSYATRYTKAALDAEVNGGVVLSFDEGAHFTGAADSPDVRWAIGKKVGTTNQFFGVTNWAGQSWQVFQNTEDYSGGADEGMYFSIVIAEDFDATDKAAALAAIEAFENASAPVTFPAAGTYYMTVANHETGRNPYLYNDLDEATGYTLQAANLDNKTNGYIWRVTSDGNGNITEIVSGTGKGIVPNSEKFTGELTSLKYASTTNKGYYYLTSDAIKAAGDHECLNASNGGQNNGHGIRTVTTWTGAGHADNHWKFDVEDLTDKFVYDVVIAAGAPAGAYVEFNGQKALNGGFFVVGGSDLVNPTAATVTGYDADVKVENQTITVTYTQTATSVDVNYNIYVDDTKVTTITRSEFEGMAPSFKFNAPAYVTVTQDVPATITAGVTSYDIKTTYNEALPFKLDGTKYNIKENRSNPLWIFYDGSALKTIAGQVPTYSNQDNYKWTFGGDWYNGFTLKNVAESKYVTFESVNPNNKDAVLTETLGAGAYFDLVQSGTYNYLKIHGTTVDAYISNRGGADKQELTHWNSSGNIGDAGAQLLITEAEEIAAPSFTFTPEEGKYYTLKVKDTDLYVNINTTTAESEAKQVVLGTEPEGFRFTATTGGYHVQNVSDKYIGGYTNTWNMSASTPEVWTIEIAEDGIMLLCAQGHMGLDDVVAGKAFYRNKGGVVFIVEEIAAPVGKDWTAYGDLLADLYSMYGTELGQYSVPGMEEADVWEALTGYNVVLSVEMESEYDNSMLGMQALKDAMQINLPKKGQLLRIKSSSDWMDEPTYLAGEKASNDHLAFVQPTTPFDAWAEDNTIWVYDGQYLVNYANGLTFATTAAQYGFATLAMYPNTTAISFQAAQNGTVGKYNVKFAGNRFMYTQKANLSNLYTDAGSNANNEGYNFELEDATTYFQLTYSDKGWATGYFPIDVAANPEYGIEAAYVINSDPENGYFTAQTIEGCVPAFTPVVLKVRTDESFRPFVKGDPNYNSTPLPSVLSGALWKQETPANSYVFNVLNEEPGFYKYTGATLGHMKAYYVATTPAASALRINFGDETLTGIMEAIEKEQFSGAIYDLQGRRVNGVQNGVFVKNGKKVIK